MAVQHKFCKDKVGKKIPFPGVDTRHEAIRVVER